MDVDNLISGSSAFPKSSLNIWKLTVHVLLKPGLENFEHYFTSMWNECNRLVVWGFFGIAFLWDGNENWPFFQICWHIECSTFTPSSFRIWNSSTGIPSLPLALLILPFDHIYKSFFLLCLYITIFPSIQARILRYILDFSHLHTSHTTLISSLTHF